MLLTACFVCFAVLELMSPTIGSPQGTPRAGFAQEEEKLPKRKPNPNLSMDRDRTKSVGGLGRGDFDEPKAGGCCVVC